MKIGMPNTPWEEMFTPILGFYSLFVSKLEAHTRQTDIWTDE